MHIALHKTEFISTTNNKVKTTINSILQNRWCTANLVYKRLVLISLAIVLLALAQGRLWLFGYIPMFYAVSDYQSDAFIFRGLLPWVGEGGPSNLPVVFLL